MKCELSYKKFEFNYSRYFDRIKIKCPFCEFTSTRTKTYKSLKQLTFHLSDQHKKEGNYFPFKLEEIQYLMQTIALAKEWRLLQ